MTSLMTPFIRHPFLALMMFMAGYFLTISVKANAQDTLVTTGDTIRIEKNEAATITGRIVAVEGDYFDMESSGRTLRVFVRDVDIARGQADTVFSPGMFVTVKGEMRGEEFDRTLVRAESVTASSAPTTTILTDQDSRRVVP